MEPEFPPYNGFGDEEDTRGYCKKLMPQPPKKDFFKIVDKKEQILRFKSKLNTSIEEDIERRFVIKYYCNTDTIEIHEIPTKNSGKPNSTKKSLSK